VHTKRLQRASSAFCGLLALFFSGISEAKLEDVEAQLQKSQKAFNDQFTQFTQDKNFMGRPRTVDGNVVQGKTKTAFNPDDKGPFQSDLTFHDKAYEIEDKAFEQKAEAELKANPGKDRKGVQRRYVYTGISEHGAISAGGGSSQLERVSYSLFDKFSKLESEKEKEEQDEKKGFSFRSVFKVNTQEVFKDANGAPANANDKDTTPDKVERWELRDEAKPEIAQVGTNSFLTLEKSAKIPNDDPNALPNLAKYYSAANQALQSLWNSTLGNLGQRRAYKAIDPKAASGNVELSESTAGCDQWGQQSVAKLQEPDPKRRQEKEEDIQRMVKQCREVAQTSYKKINPRFEKPEESQGGGQNGQSGQNPQGQNNEKLTFKGPQEEDARERDWRVQLSVLEKVKTQTQDVQSNWKYEQKDNTAAVTTGFAPDGQANQTENLRMIDQVDRYNQNLQEAAKGLQDVKSRFSQMPADPKAPLQFMKTGEESALDITKFPEQAAMEGFETPVINKQPKPAENYDDLVNDKGAQ